MLAFLHYLSLFNCIYYGLVISYYSELFMFNKLHYSKQLLLATILLLCLELPLNAKPLYVDINSELRSDMQTNGWINWLPSADNMSHIFADTTVSISSVDSNGILELFGNKAVVVYGNTVGADGVVLTDTKPPVMVIRIDGLTPGRHSFVGFHHALDNVEDTYSISTSDHKVSGIKSSLQAHHNDEVGTSYIEFRAARNRPVFIHIESVSGNRVILSGFALDISDPAQKAIKPVPANLERHADGDSGTVTLQWTASRSAVAHHLYLACDTDLDTAIQKLETAKRLTTLTGSTYTAPIVPNNSMLFYAWRVDSEDSHGNITRGDIWHFRLRHLAFPTAEGYGRFAIGGRGGRVIHVINLNDSGPGSLRQAVEAIGPRTVVFDVSGIISLESKLVFRDKNEFLTIAGQTAPGKGICIRNYTFGGLGGRDTIIRHIRLRLGDLTGKTMDGMGLAGCDHCIVDHCSISWTIDEAFSSRGAKNITFQRNIISEALNIAGHSHYEQGKAHGYAGSIGGNIGSFHHSLLAHNAGRNWSLAGGTDQAGRHSGRLDIRNMVVYNWNNRTTDGGAMQVQFVNNYYKPGPASQIKTYLNPQFEHPDFGPQQYYVTGNITEGITQPEGPIGPFKGVKVKGRQEAPATVPQPFFESYVTTHTACQAYNNVLADVGCNVPTLDDHDKRVINEVITGTAAYKGSISGLPGLPDSQQDVGSWEDYPEIHRPDNWDTDRDGMPDFWEINMNLKPDDPADGSDDPDRDGYTNLEDYLNSLTTLPQ